MEKMELIFSRLKNGEMIIITDDASRENEGDIMMAAEFTKAKDLNFMSQFGRGLICHPIDQKRAQKLHLPLQVPANEGSFETAFTVSIDAAEGIGSGISVFDREKTLSLLCDESSVPQNFKRPGHLFPLISHPKGLRARGGHTEASLELLRLSGLKPVATICEVLNPDGSVAQGKQIQDFGLKHQLPLVSVEEILQYLEKTNS